MNRTILKINERFWRHVDKNGPIPEHCPEIGNCWEWTGGSSGGYGMFSKPRISGGKYIVCRANRVSYELNVGQIPPGMDCCHRCDNPKCVRPDHLFIGTAKQNMADALSKSRLPVGESRWNSKLKEADVIAIRSEKRQGHTELALNYGVAESTIRSIRDGTSWKYLTSETSETT